MSMGPDDDRTVGTGIGTPPPGPGETALPPPTTEQALTPPPTELAPESPETIGPGSEGWPDLSTDLRAEDFTPSGELIAGRTLFGKYVVKERLGQGGMGTVWLVRHRELNVDRALKLIVSQIAFDEGARARFRLEARLMARLAHPNIVTVADARIGSGSAYIEMEYIPGRSLKDAMEPGEPMPLERVVDLVGQLCDALQAAHELGIVHRDLKPANLMLVGGREPGREQLKVLDFGIAKLLGADRAEHLGDAEGLRTAPGLFVGTPAYASPEQIQDPDVDARSDIYSLGVVLFELLTGRRPFANRTAMVDHMFKEPPSFREVNPGVRYPPGVEKLVRRCLEKDPAKRPQSARQVAEDLRRAAGLDRERRAAEQGGPSRRRASRRVLLAAALVPLALAAALALALRPSPSFGARVEVEPSVRAGEEFVLPIVVERVRFPGPVRLEIPTLPPGLAVVGGGEAPEGATPGGWAVDAGGAVASVRLRADLNAAPGVRSLPISASAGGIAHELSVPLTVEPARVDLPPGFEPAEGARLAPVGPLHCPEAIVRRFEDGAEATFLLIPRGGPGDPAPFYILRDKVSNALYREFAEPPPPGGSDLPPGARVEPSPALASEVQADWPVMNVSARDAHRFAAWLGGEGPRFFGRLPTIAQWDKAAGLNDPGGRVGPFEPGESADEVEGIAIGRDDPAPVGRSPRDVSPFGVRDMAGNGFEWTRNATSGRFVPLPDGRNDHIYLRGQGFTMETPLRFSDLESEDRWRSLGYEESFYEIGFRVVLEIGAG